MKKENKKVRQSNFELMRIISMFMIVLWHVIKNNINFVQTPDVVHFFLIIIICTIVIHVNSFVMVNGYFSFSKTRNSWKKACSLLGVTWFYKVAMAVVLFFVTTGVIGKFELFKEFFPLDVIRSYWFINCYILLLLLSPFINILLDRLTESQYRKLLLTSFLLFSIVPFITNQTMVSNDGFNLVQFIFLYLIGAYFKKYPIEKNYHFKKFSKNKIQLLSLSLFLICVFFNVCIYFLSLYLKSIDQVLLQEIGEGLHHSIFCYSSPIIIIQTIAYFQFFRTLSIQKRWINSLASLTFGIYLFHENYYLKLILYAPFRLHQHAQNMGIFVYAFVVAISIFLVGLVIEWIRKQIAKFLKGRKWVKNIQNRCIHYIEQIES